MEYTDLLFEELANQEVGYVTTVEIQPGGKRDGLDYGPVVIEVVVLDAGAQTLAYRYSDDTHDDDWQLGSIEDVVEAVLDNREQARVEERLFALENKV